MAKSYLFDNSLHIREYLSTFTTEKSFLRSLESGNFFSACEQKCFFSAIKSNSKKFLIIFERRSFFGKGGD